MKQDDKYIENLKNPYKGLYQYTSKDESLFFGREKETSDLVQMIKNNQLTVIYGDSGTGKTSLIKAKLFPELSRQYYFPIYIRFNYLGKTDPLTQLRETIYKELNSWDKQTEPFTSDLTLIEYAAQTSILNGLVKPILFFDQFEELFTLGQKYVEQKALENFILQISDLVEMRLPDRKKRRQLIPAEKFTNETSNEEVCTENVLRFSVVISMRQEYLAQLDDLRFSIPSIGSNRYRIKKFDHKQAHRAIVQPAKVFVSSRNPKTELEIINGKAALKVINQLKRLGFTKIKELIEAPGKTKNVASQFFSLITDFFRKFKKKSKHFQEKADIDDIFFQNSEIDPTILSLYCHQLYKEGNEVEYGLREISEEQVVKSPADEIIKNYYNESLSRRKIKLAIENFLITPDGRRVLVPLKDFVGRFKGDEKDIIDLVNKTGILRIYGEGDQREIELAHDQIAKRALRSKKEREANIIKRNAAIIFLTGLAVIILGIATTAYYIQRERRNVTISYLENQISEKNNAISKLVYARDSFQTINSNLLEIYRLGGDSLQKYVALLLRRTSELRDAQARVVRLQNENANWVTKITELEDGFQKLSDENNISGNRVRRLLAENAVWESRNRIQQDSIKYKDSLLITRTSELNSAERRISQLIAEKSESIDMIDKLRQQIVNLKAFIQSYEKKYDKLPDSLKIRKDVDQQ